GPTSVVARFGVTVTSAAKPPAPPKPPTDAVIEGVLFLLEKLNTPATLRPPLPPPPPSDCATTPLAWSWVVEMIPVELTITTSALPPPAPKPPSEAAMLRLLPVGIASVPAKLKPPLPPPPPIDCAN